MSVGRILACMHACFTSPFGLPSQEMFPEVHLSLAKLLAMSEEEVEACSLVFSVDVELSSGKIETWELLPGQADLPVTTHSRAQYVELYTQVRALIRCHSVFPVICMLSTLLL